MIIGTRDAVGLGIFNTNTSKQYVPHIVLDSAVNLEAMSAGFRPILQKGESLIRINDMFVHNQKHAALFSAVAMDRLHQEYFIEVTTRESKTTIRLLPLTDPQKTDAVKRSLVLVFEFIKEHHPSHRITRTNLRGLVPGVPTV